MDEQRKPSILSRLGAFLGRHPRLATWLVLSLGMVLILLVAAGGKGLQPHQVGWLVILTIALAGACARIIGWE